MTVSEKLRLVQGLHSHAEMFGFHWDDGSDWTWHDVTCKIADEVDAENDRLREVVSDGEENARLILHESRVLQAENIKLREYITRLEQANIVLDSDNCDLRNDMKDMQFFIAENAKLREACAELLKMAESSDPEWLHWPEMHDELRELGVKIVKL